MSTGLHLLVGENMMVASLRELAPKLPLVVVLHRAMLQLEHELGGMEQALTFLVDLSREHDKPVAVNLPTGPDRSQTVFIAPTWSQDRLRGWIGGHHETLEEAFGEIAWLGPWGPSAGQSEPRA